MEQSVLSELFACDLYRDLMAIFVDQNLDPELVIVLALRHRPRRRWGRNDARRLRALAAFHILVTANSHALEPIYPANLFAVFGNAHRLIGQAAIRALGLRLVQVHVLIDHRQFGVQSTATPFALLLAAFLAGILQPICEHCCLPPQRSLDLHVERHHALDSMAYYW